MIEVQNLSFSFGNRPVLQNVNLSLKQGECVAVLGDNGAGKSTLVSCISRLRRPSSGPSTGPASGPQPAPLPAPPSNRAACQR